MQKVRKISALNPHITLTLKTLDEKNLDEKKRPVFCLIEAGGCIECISQAYPLISVLLLLYFLLFASLCYVCGTC